MPVNIHLQSGQRGQSEDSVAMETSSCHLRGRSKKKFQQIFGDDKIDEEYPVVHKRPTKKKLYPQTPLHRVIRAARLVCLYSLDGEHPSNIALDCDQGFDEPAYEHHC